MFTVRILFVSNYLLLFFKYNILFILLFNRLVNVLCFFSSYCEYSLSESYERKYGDIVRDAYNGDQPERQREIFNVRQPDDLLVGIFIPPQDPLGPLVQNAQNERAQERHDARQGSCESNFL